MEGHGYIDKEEFACMMKDLCIPLDSLDAEFRLIDVNGDFKVTFQEFYQCLYALHLAAQR